MHRRAMVAQLRADGTHTAEVLPGAFSDRSGGDVAVPCAGFRSRVDVEDASVTLRLSSRCVLGGNYGAVRVAVLTERGADADEAPETQNGDWTSSPWISRG